MTAGLCDIGGLMRNADGYAQTMDLMDDMNRALSAQAGHAAEPSWNASFSKAMEKYGVVSRCVENDRQHHIIACGLAA